ncbi:hypothetical protein C7974DRAFT_377267 [Boeremia exigua]|uniref:uncharacterized protein n=1 Tax=Boeremia exigua TaxID=749465 RepID=UPI001E8DF06B|nr:uncharacterized protein C7974DRAFT_377267 [Boeremia exigua]KAH6625812.1 hypothetical protein C7974DRAFT_377267 [Boeremia exigua]
MASASESANNHMSPFITDDNPLRMSPKALENASPPVCQGAPEQNERFFRSGSCMCLRTIKSNMAPSSPYMMLVVITVLVISTSLIVSVGIGFCPSAPTSEHGLKKRMEAGHLDNMMLYVLGGGMVIALVVGISTSWILQRKQFTAQKKQKDDSRKGIVWKANRGYVV